MSQNKRNSKSSGDTPGKPKLKIQRSGSSRKSLFQASEPEGKEIVIKPQDPWRKSELQGLVEYIALFHQPKGNIWEWPTHKNSSFWNKCAEAVQQYSKAERRTGNACRMKCLRLLKKKYKSIDEAEDDLGICYFQQHPHHQQPVNSTPKSSCNTSEVLSPTFMCSPLPASSSSKLPGQVIEEIVSSFGILTKNQRTQLLQELFTVFIQLDINIDIVPSYLTKDFINLIGKGLGTLYDHKRENLFLYMGKCFGQYREDGTPRLPLDKMPFGLIAHNLKFFSCDNAGIIEAPKDYKTWMETMYSRFGQSWASLHLGPMWSNQMHESAQTKTSDKRDVVSLALEESGLSDICSEESGISTSDGSMTLSSPNTAVAREPKQHQSFVAKTINQDRPPMNYSTLWSNITREQAIELHDAEVTVREVQEMHGIIPVQHIGKPSCCKDPLQAKVNIAGPSPVTLRRSIAKSGFTRNTDIQIKALKTAHDNNKTGRWWIKADATDINSGLRESMDNKWSGDVDMGDGAIKKLHKEYLTRLSFIRGLGLKDRHSCEKLEKDLHYLTELLQHDIETLNSGLAVSVNQYNASIKRTNVQEQALFALAWEIEGCKKLLSRNFTLKETVKEIKQRILTKEKGTTGNLPKDLKKLREDFAVYYKGVYTKMRQAASHLLVFMISDEQRNYKPYAIPVRVVTYKSITDVRVQKLKDELKNAMTQIGMKVVGFVTDGEWNKIRTMGTQRPVSVIQLMMDAKEEARVIGASLIEQYLKPGKPETKGDSLKSLMAMYLYKRKIEDHFANGVDFKHHLYVAEVDGNTSEPQYDREDHNHVLKRITTSLRLGLIPNVDLRYFVDALNDAHTGVTYTALTGKRKQSVPDCEKLFSPGVIRFMKDNGHKNEARIVETIHNWHKASDGRGLNEATRKSYNLAMLDWLLEDWMPWFTANRDYSSMDINRPIKGIQGLTREVVVAVIANIESQEDRRRQVEIRGLTPEHPRASTTDDVEGFFSVIHEMLGSSFDLKTFYDQYPKILNEFNKRIDPSTPFFYWTSRNERYTLGPMKSFNEPSGQAERLDRVVFSRRADPGVFHANRASLPQRGRLSVRAEWHRAPECLPLRAAP